MHPTNGKRKNNEKGFKFEPKKKPKVGHKGAKEQIMF
jgi:hypothetical protein